MSDIAANEASIRRALDLNNRHAVELSFQTFDQFTQLIRMATLAKWGAGQHGFLIALDETAPYRNPNFDWFRARYPQFVYVDRVVIDPAYRGRGLARQLYEDLFRQVRQSGRSLVVCEVSSEPPNPIWDAFHAGLNFAEVGSAMLSHRGKIVRYLSKDLAARNEANKKGRRI